jgi:hypothetical protein
MKVFIHKEPGSEKPKPFLKINRYDKDLGKATANFLKEDIYYDKN